MSVVAVMKCNPVDVVPDDAARWCMMPKYDGWRIAAGRHAGGCWLQGASGNRVHSVPYLQAALEAWLPVDTIVDGEIVDLTGRTQWNRTQSILSSDRRHVPSPAAPALTYVVFDLLHLSGANVRAKPLTIRLELLEKLGELGDAQGLVGAARTVMIAPHHEARPSLAQAWVDAGWEGVVCKRWDSRYRPGANGAWVKWKPDHEIEAVCTGTYEATPGSKYDGVAVGGITFHVKHADGREYDGRAAGMNDRLRGALYRDQFIEQYPQRSEYVGRVVELTHKGVTNDGALRHPQYKRFRDEVDKPVPRPQRVAPAQASVGGRIRNYAAMKDEKLIGCLWELIHGGDAYDRCMSGGSGDLDRDVASVRALLDERGIAPERYRSTPSTRRNR